MPEKQPRLSPLVDITEIPLDQKPENSSALQESIRNILEDVQRNAESISGWASAVD